MSTGENGELQDDLENADNATEEAMIKAKHGAKDTIAGGFRAAAKKLAKVGGDVSVEGSRKKVFLWPFGVTLTSRLVRESIGCCSAQTSKTTCP